MLFRSVPASEILIVTTPQVAAAEVAERAGRIAHQLKQQIIGVIENMSSFSVPGSDLTIDLFGSGGGDETAARLSTLVGADIPLLGKIPFDQELREGGDQGEAIVFRSPESPAATEFIRIAQSISVRKRSLLGVRLGLST